ncbi:AraC family transcriptional regulator [Pseudarthrobacter sp. SSS035]|uniref:helix-turn-helix transcriptional regulator n=1 Tax=Pseudarthrobacter sp. SSS035 TaxID=2931399 RepID=UPI00200BACAC|nr:AraC family transcriptional regulator [Pseudarthrobacter sp. SSS035]
MSLNDIEPKMLHLADYISGEESHNVGRRRATGAFRGTLHTHDFAELFWVEDGSLTHLINGESQVLTEGDVVFIRPADTHTFRPILGREFSTVSVAFPAETLHFLEQRYFSGTPWPWSGTPLPSTHHLGRLQLARLSELLVSNPSSRLLLEQALLELLYDVAEPAGKTLPLWLRTAIDQVADDPIALSRGAPALAQLACRSREHVNRILREQTGRTTTETLNELRLTRAANELRMTDRSIATVAAECGLGNLSHFYRLFAARFGTTPRRYRIRHAALIPGSQRSNG